MVRFFGSFPNLTPPDGVHIRCVLGHTLTVRSGTYTHGAFWDIISRQALKRYYSIHFYSNPKQNRWSSPPPNLTSDGSVFLASLPNLTPPVGVHIRCALGHTLTVRSGTYTYGAFWDIHLRQAQNVQLLQIRLNLLNQQIHFAAQLIISF